MTEQLRRIVVFGLIAVVALAAAAGNAGATPHAYYLFLAGAPQGCEDCYVPLLITRQTLDEVASSASDSAVVLITARRSHRGLSSSELTFFLGFGLLPLWTSAAYVYLESLRTTQAEYWAAAPWLISITLAMAGITCLVFWTTGGARSRKLTRAVVCFFILSLLVLAGAGIFWNQRTTREANIEAEKAAGRIYVERSREVASAIPGRIRAGLSESRVARDGLAVRYIYYVYPEHDLASASAVMAVVDVSRSSGVASFRIACVVSKADYTRRSVPGGDPCRG